MTASLALLTACLAFVADDAAPTELLLGDPAPALTLQEFVKGDPLEKFEPGTTYVVEFWATWCGPCKRSIPHISELQAKYKDVVFIGVDVMEDDPDGVKEFVEKMGDKMAYRVAIDVPGEGPGEGNDPPQGKMALAWLDASHQSGIPVAFVVNGEGLVAWIGHPMEMDDPLAEIVAGKWNLESRAKVAQLQRELNKAFAAGDGPALRNAIDSAVEADPAQEKELGVIKLMTLMAAEGDSAKAETYARHLIKEPLQGNWMMLLGLANFIVSAGGNEGERLPEGLRPQPASEKLKALALQTAKQAVELADKEEQPAAAAARDALARIYFSLGNLDKAVEQQESAIGKAKGTQLEGNAEMLEHLRVYRKAIKQAGEKKPPKAKE